MVKLEYLHWAIELRVHGFIFPTETHMIWLSNLHTTQQRLIYSVHMVWGLSKIKLMVNDIIFPTTCSTNLSFITPSDSHQPASSTSNHQPLNAPTWSRKPMKLRWWSNKKYEIRRTTFFESISSDDMSRTFKFRKTKVFQNILAFCSANRQYGPNIFVVNWWGFWKEIITGWSRLPSLAWTLHYYISLQSFIGVNFFLCSIRK